MKLISIVITASLCACGTEQSLSTAQQQFDALTAEARDAANCGQQNADCVQSDTFAPRNHACRSDMRACLLALRPPLAGQRSPALDELHGCNATYATCAEADGAVDGGASDCEAAHRACLCTVFSDGWADFCASVAASCANDTSARCAHLTARCTQPAPQQPGLCD